MGERGVITVIGLDGSPLSPQARAAIEAATLLVGGRRQLAAVPAGNGASTVTLGEVGPALAALAGHRGNAVVLASGDPGFFGIVRALHRHGLAATVLPAVSSVALAFARAGLSWDDAVVVSAHGRDLRQAVNVCRAHPKVAVLTGPGAGPAEIGTALTGWRRRMIVCEHLGTSQERITGCRPAASRRRSWADPNVVLVLAGAATAGEGPAATAPAATSLAEVDEGPGWIWPLSAAAAGWALPEEEFDTRGAVITKSEVRALALARLAPAPGRLVWDVGAGTGSVGVECARFGAAVVAVERDGQRCARVRANARRHRVDVRVVHAEAPAALGRLPEPDSVFIGGGGAAVVEAVAARQPGRIVVARAAIERAGETHTALVKAGYAVEGALVQAARFAPLPGDAHRLAGTNPVFLLWAAPVTGFGPHGSPAEPADSRGAPR
ncbi:MAG TPA: precorrin-6y C5,15-methyltransferase (decarboxylating) subunit CbiE [Streptosporangiaceae bacterium]